MKIVKVCLSYPLVTPNGQFDENTRDKHLVRLSPEGKNIWNFRKKVLKSKIKNFKLPAKLP